MDRIFASLNLLKHPEELKKSLEEVSKLPLEERENILKKADETLPREIGTKARELILDFCYDKSFCKDAGIAYGCPNTRLIKTAIANYLLNQT